MSPLSTSIGSEAENKTQNTELDRQSLSYCVSLIENGVNPEALAVRASFLLSHNQTDVMFRM